MERVPRHLHGPVYLPELHGEGNELTCTPRGGIMSAAHPYLGPDGPEV